MKLIKIQKQIIASLLIATMLICQFGNYANAGEATGNVYYDGEYFDSLEDAIEKANDSDETRITITISKNIEIKKTIILNDTSKEYYIGSTLENSLTSTMDTPVFTLQSNTKLTLSNVILRGNKEELTAAKNTYIFDVKENAELNLESASIENFWNAKAIIYLKNATLKMDSNCYIKDNKTTSAIQTEKECKITGGNLENNSVSAACINTKDLVNIDNVNITNNACSDYYGGGIKTSGTLYLSNSKIEKNTARYGGGGIYCTSSSALYMNKCQINNNSGTYRGGGIYSESNNNIEIYNTIINGNKSDFTASVGAGICIGGSSAVVFAGVTFKENYTCVGGAIQVSKAHVTIKKPGEYNTVFGKTVTEKNVISNNRVYTNSSGQGGAISASNAATVIIEQAEIKNNIAGVGGAIFNAGTMELQDVTISGNIANYGVDGYSNIKRGEGIYQNGYLTIGTSSNVTDQICLAQTKILSVKGPLLYHTSKYSPLKIVVEDKTVADTRDIITYIGNSEEEAFYAVQSGIINIAKDDNLPKDYTLYAKDNTISIVTSAFDANVICKDYENKAAKAVVFDVYKYNAVGKGIKIGRTVSSDEDGKINITSLSLGEYYLKMVSVPEKYELDNVTLYRFTIDSTTKAEIKVNLEKADMPPVAVAEADKTTVKVNEKIKFSGKNSTDDKGIKSYYWSFGDGTSARTCDATHSFNDEGVYTATLIVTDTKGNKTQKVLYVNVDGIDEKEHRLTVNVCDANKGTILSGATIEIIGEGANDSKSGATNTSGIFKSYQASGNYTVIVYKNGYYTRSTNVCIKDSATEITVPLNNADSVAGEIKVTEMTYDEIVSAGIDVEAEGNQNVYKYQVTLEFEATTVDDMVLCLLTYYLNKNNEILGIEKSNDPDSDRKVYPVSDKFYLVVNGGSKWLKEMYDVQLIVINNSSMETIENCEATINLPTGLSLAEMVEEEENTATVKIGTIGKNQTVVKHWYVRGDSAGSYYIGATISGEFTSQGIEPQKFNTVFTTTSPIEVLGGNAMFLTIKLNRFVQNREVYKIFYEFRNTSKKSIYNLSLDLADNMWIIEGADNDNPIVEEFKPGDKIKIGQSERIYFDGEKDYYKLVSAGLNVLSGNVSIPYGIQVENNCMDYIKEEFSFLPKAESADPVSLLTGNFEYEYTDLTLTGKNDLVYKRYYNSNAENGYHLSKGWSDEYTYYLEENDIDVEVTMPNNQVMYFQKIENQYKSQNGSECTLEKEGDGYILSNRTGEEYHFDSKGYIQKITGRNNQEINFDYNHNKLSKVSSNTGNLYFAYNNNGKLTKVEDKKGYYVELEYNNGELIKVTNADNDSLVYSYDENGYMSKIQDFNGVVSLKNTYDEDGRVVKQYVEDEGTYTFTYDLESRYNECKGEDNYFKGIYYDEDSRITAELSNNGSVQYEYNNLNQRISSTDAEGQITRYSYDEHYNLSGILYADGTTEYYEYDENNQLVSSKDANDNTETYEYDTNGNMISKTDGRGNVTTYTYDENGCCTMQTNPLGDKVLSSYDEKGNCIMVTDANGNNSYTGYDEQGRLTSFTNAIGNTITYDYTMTGKLIGETDVDGKTSEYGVSPNGYNVYESDKRGNKTEYTYNKQNKVSSKTTALGNVTTYKYNKKGDLTTIKDAKGSSKLYTYDGDGNISSYTDENGNLWKYEYDGNRNVTKVIDPLSNELSAEYDSKGRTISETDSNGNIKTYAYDGNGNVISETNELGEVIQYAYDKNGNKIKSTDANGNETLYEYDELNRIISMVDGNGLTSKYEYDPVGNLVKIIDSNGKEISYKYNALCVVSEMTDKNGNITKYEHDAYGSITKQINPDNTFVAYKYDANGNLKTVTDERGYSQSYQYDAENRLIEKTDEKKSVTTYSYDAVGNLIKTIHPDGSIELKIYDACGNVTEVTDAAGHKSKYSYDKLGRVISIADNKDRAKKVKYDANGNILEITDKNNNSIKYKYDELNRVIQVTDASGNKKSYGYDANGNTISYEDSNQNKLYYTYDAENRLISTTKGENNVESYDYYLGDKISKYKDGDGAETLYEYDANGNVISMTDACGNKRWFKYDSMNRVKSVTDGKGASKHYQYDSSGNMVKETDEKEKSVDYTYDEKGNCLSQTTAYGTTSYEYDCMDRLVKVTDANGNDERYKYDEVGNVISHQDKNGNVTTYKYDENGNATSVTDANGNKSLFEYDGEGNLLKSELNKDGDSEVLKEITLYTYDGNNMLVKEVDPNGNITSYTYDGEGNITSKTDADKRKTTYEYNDLNLLSTIRYSDGTVTAYRYDHSGALILMSDSVGTTSYELDLLDRIKSVTNEKGKTVSYEYDCNGKQTSIKYPDESIVSYRYDEAGNILDVTDNKKKISYEYDDIGNVIKYATGDGITEYRLYDNLGNITEISQESNRNEKQVVYSYKYDNEGNLISEYDRPLGQSKKKVKTYSYDALNRLVDSTESVDGKSVSTAYEYDNIGNLIKEISGKNITEYRYNKQNRLMEKVSGNSSGEEMTAYQYDQSGNMTTQITTNSLGKVLEKADYTYNGRGKLAKGTKTNNGKTESSIYEYNGLGQLVRKSTGSKNQMTEKSYMIDANSETADILYESINDDTTLKYVYGNERISVTIDTENPADSSDVSNSQGIGGLSNLGITIKLHELRTSISAITQQCYSRLNFSVNTISMINISLSKSESIWNILMTERGYGESLNKNTTAVSETYYLRTDRLGSTYAVNDKGGNTLVSTRYNEWGESESTLSVQNTKVTEHSTAMQTVLAEEVGTNYTGYEYDEVLDMYYACDRMYDAQDKRFTTKDPVKGNVYDPVSINPYVYVSDNPLKYIDPLGQSPDILGTAWNGIKSGANYVADGVTSAATSVANGVKKTVKDVVSGVQKVWDKGVDFVQDVWDTTKGFFTRLGCLISNIDNCSKTLLGWSLGIGGMCVLAATPLGWTGAAATLVPGIVTGTLLGGATQAASTALSGGDKNEVWENFLGGAADGLLYSGAMSVVTAGSTAYYYGKVAGTVANTANKVSESFASAGTNNTKTISYTEYDNIYQSSIQNAGKDKIMLGKYDGGGASSYITKAGNEYEYFSLGNEWDVIKRQYGYTDDDMFKLFNESFLDDGINAGKTFHFSHNPVKDTKALGDEYQYLLKNGYKWDNETMTMKPRK